MDLEAGGQLDEGEDPVEIANRVMHRYDLLWNELTGEERFEQGDRWRVDERIRRLNNLGFDVDELEMSTDVDGTSIRIQPKVVDAGHHSRRLMHLTGLDVEENQARRLLNDLRSYRAWLEQRDGVPVSETVAGHRWVATPWSASTGATGSDCNGWVSPSGGSSVEPATSVGAPRPKRSRGS